MHWFFLIIFVLSTQMQKFLDIKNVTWSSIGTSFHDKTHEIGHIFVWQAFDDLESTLNKTLLPEIKETQTEGKDSGETVFEIFFLLLEENLGDTLCSVLVAWTTEDETNRQGSDGLKFNRVVTVDDNWWNKLKKVCSCTSSISKGETH